MKFIMKIGDIATIPNIGDVVIGKNHEIEKDDISLLCKKGQEIIVEGKKEKLRFKVKDIRLTFSMTEKIIISMEFEKSENFKKLRIGDSIYSI